MNTHIVLKIMYANKIFQSVVYTTQTRDTFQSTNVLQIKTTKYKPK